VEAVSTSIRLTKDQVDFCKKKGKNISWFIRSLIDREIGAEKLKMEMYAKAVQQRSGNSFVWKPTS